jgi:hypothetical protein
MMPQASFLRAGCSDRLAVARDQSPARISRAGISKAEIARRLQIGRTSVRRILAAK